MSRWKREVGVSARYLAGHRRSRDNRLGPLARRPISQSSANGAADMIYAADGCSMMHSENSTRSDRAERGRFHGENFLLLAARPFAAGLALPGPARRVAAQP